MPAFVRDAGKEQMLELALIENIQREDLNPIEIAMAFERLALDHRLTHEQIAQKTGKDRSTVTNFLRLLRLAPAAREALINGYITMGHAKAMLNLPGSIQQEPVLRQIIAGQMSVREAEGLVKKAAAAESNPSDPQIIETKEHKSERIDPNIRAAVDEMSMALGTKVKLTPRGDHAGRLEIEYYSSEDLDRIYSLIVK